MTTEVDWQARRSPVKSILDTPGLTPLVALGRVTEGSTAEILVKLEYFGPSGSVKDRCALGLIRDAQSRTSLLAPESDFKGFVKHVAIAITILGELLLIGALYLPQWTPGFLHGAAWLPAHWDPDTALTIRNALLGGRRGGIFTALGVAAGQAVWALATSVGIVALLVASEPVFLAVKLAGQR